MNIETLARALALRHIDAGDKCEGAELEAIAARRAHLYVDDVRAVLEAMRHLDSGALENAAPALRRAAIDGEQPWTWHVERIWQAMIDSILTS